jgi:hypothetical protein
MAITIGNRKLNTGKYMYPLETLRSKKYSQLCISYTQTRDATKHSSKAQDDRHTAHSNIAATYYSLVVYRPQVPKSKFKNKCHDGQQYHDTLKFTGHNSQPY